MTQRYLVTGCAGFIAARVTQLLLEAGHRVVGRRQPQRRLRRASEAVAAGGLLGNPAFDVPPVGHYRPGGASSSGFATTPGGEPVRGGDQPGRPGRGVAASVENPQLYYRTNCEGTLHLLEACRRWGIEKFVLASTSSLYGEHNPVPFREDADTDRPLSPYAASKKAAETMAYTYHHLHGIDVTVARYFTVYGPAGRPDMSVLRFIRRIAEGRADRGLRRRLAAARLHLHRRHRPGHRGRAGAAGLRGDESRRRPARDARPADPADRGSSWARRRRSNTAGPSGRRSGDLGRHRPREATAGLVAASAAGRRPAAHRGLVPGKPRRWLLDDSTSAEAPYAGPVISGNWAAFVYAVAAMPR